MEVIEYPPCLSQIVFWVLPLFNNEIAVAKLQGAAAVQVPPEPVGETNKTLFNPAFEGQVCPKVSEKKRKRKRNKNFFGIFFVNSNFKKKVETKRIKKKRIGQNRTSELCFFLL